MRLPLPNNVDKKSRQGDSAAPTLNVGTRWDRKPAFGCSGNPIRLFQLVIPNVLYITTRTIELCEEKNFAYASKLLYGPENAPPEL